MYTSLSGYQQKMNHLHADLQATNELGKYAVAVQTEVSKVVGHVPLGKSTKFTKTTFYCLKTSENKVCVGCGYQKVCKPR